MDIKSDGYLRSEILVLLILDSCLKLDKMCVAVTDI